MSETLAAALESVLARSDTGEAGSVTNLQRLSGGANMETWAFDYRRGSGDRQQLILRRRPAGVGGAAETASAISLAAEADLLVLARRARVPVPTVVERLRPQDPSARAWS
jgi:aminoglycoside phosphotransferase (APT) family kinase protein